MLGTSGWFEFESSTGVTTAFAPSLSFAAAGRASFCACVDSAALRLVPVCPLVSGTFANCLVCAGLSSSSCAGSCAVPAAVAATSPASFAFTARGEREAAAEPEGRSTARAVCVREVCVSAVWTESTFPSELEGVVLESARKGSAATGARLAISAGTTVGNSAVVTASGAVVDTN